MQTQVEDRILTYRGLFTLPKIFLELALCSVAVFLLLPFCAQGQLCVPVPSGLVGWWQAEGNTLNGADTNHGTWVGNATYAAGRVGQAFNFDGGNSYVSMPSSSSINFSGSMPMTIETWVYRTGNASTMHIVGKRNGCQLSDIQYQLAFDPTGGLEFVSNGGNFWVNTYRQLPLNTWQHLAVTYDGTTAVIYIDGQSVASGSGSLGAALSAPLKIGNAGECTAFAGLIDEVSIYNRALTTNEIQSIYNAGTSGKCAAPSPPHIFSQPTNQTAFVGETAILRVSAGGTAPLGYQWSLNATNIDGATDAVLTLTNVQLSQTGNYSVLVSNAINSVISSNAFLTINLPPLCVSPSSNLVSWWRAEGSALDNVDGSNGTLRNGAAFTAGRVGQAFSFDGVDDYVEVPDSVNVGFGPTAPMSFELWAYRTGGGSGQSLLGKRVLGSGLGGINYQLDFEDSPGPYGNGIVFITGSGNYAASGTTLPVGQWTHLAGTFDGSTLRLYVNGELKASSAGTLGAPNGASLMIGGSGGYATFSGSIDELALYNRALIPTEIQAIYDAGSSGKCANAVPPLIITQPADQAVTVGSTTVLNVVAGGTAPLSYQWSFNSTNITGATNASLTLTNIQMAQAGSYSVVISNIADSVTSSNALLTVNPAPACALVTTHLVSWWQAGGNALDSVGGNNGALQNGVDFNAGRVGQAFRFDGVDDYAEVPHSANMSFGSTSPMSFELWVYRTGGASVQHLLGKRVPGSGISGINYQLDFEDSPGPFGSGIVFITGSGNFAASGTTLPVGQWTHLAGTFDGSTLRLYVNGELKASSAGTLGAPNGASLMIGGSGGYATFGGLIDELALYGRTLTATEIQAIYSAGSSGKCAVAIPPFIIAQPPNRTVAVGTTTTFSVTAGGTAPLSYQWSLNATNISGATNASLTLNNVQFSQSGNYSVLVTNAVDSVISSNAVLTVNFPPAALHVVSTTAMAGGSVSVPIILVANGNENALGFSLNFNTQRLAFASVTLGSGAVGASLLPNTSEAGKIGIALALDSGSNFVAGTQEVVRVNFTSPMLTGNIPVVTTLSFGDLPTDRQLSDALAHDLSATYSSGNVTLLPSDLEGDVAPRPTGNRAVSITDWVQVGRFVAGLDIAADGGEFQRADCAPRGTSGDGILKVTDWVQAGRYAASLDSLTVVGGPTSPVAEAPPAQRGGISVASANRQVSVADATAIQGVRVTLPVNLESQGNESALGFSLVFDPAKFTYSGVSLGNGAAGATLNVNTNQLANGKLGLALAFPNGSFATGLRELAKVNLIPTLSGVGNDSVVFGDQPVMRAVSDPAANELTADYVPGAVTVNPLPSLTIKPSDASVSLSWPVWAQGFDLQTSDSNVLVLVNWTNVVGTLQTNAGNIVLTIPASETTKFFRLHRP